MLSFSFRQAQTEPAGRIQGPHHHVIPQTARPQTTPKTTQNRDFPKQKTLKDRLPEVPDRCMPFMGQGASIPRSPLPQDFQWIFQEILLKSMRFSGHPLAPRKTSDINQNQKSFPLSCSSYLKKTESPAVAPHHHTGSKLADGRTSLLRRMTGSGSWWSTRVYELSLLNCPLNHAMPN